jgi:hypothetical protein
MLRTLLKRTKPISTVLPSMPEGYFWRTTNKIQTYSEDGYPSFVVHPRYFQVQLRLRKPRLFNRKHSLLVAWENVYPEFERGLSYEQMRAQAAWKIQQSVDSQEKLAVATQYAHYR